MKLVVKGIGSFEIIDAARASGGDISVKSSDGFRSISAKTGMQIHSAILSEVYFEWGLIIWFVGQKTIDEEHASAFEIENQDDVYRLNATL